MKYNVYSEFYNVKLHGSNADVSYTTTYTVAAESAIESCDKALSVFKEKHNLIAEVLVVERLEYSHDFIV